METFAHCIEERLKQWTCRIQSVLSGAKSLTMKDTVDLCTSSCLCSAGVRDLNNAVVYFSHLAMIT